MRFVFRRGDLIAVGAVESTVTRLSNQHRQLKPHTVMSLGSDSMPIYSASGCNQHAALYTRQAMSSAEDAVKDLVILS